MERFELVVIGGGPSGYAAAMRAVDFNKHVLLVEREHLGGAGIFNGALSSKTFWELSQEINSAREKFARRRVPSRRYGTPEEIAHMVLNLALPSASFVTGTAIPVDGGLRVQNT